MMVMMMMMMMMMMIKAKANKLVALGKENYKSNDVFKSLHRHYIPVS